MNSSQQKPAVCVLLSFPESGLELVEAAVNCGSLSEAVREQIRKDGKLLLEGAPPEDPRFASVLAATVAEMGHTLTPDDYREWMEYLVRLGWDFRCRYRNVLLPFQEQDDGLHVLAQQVENLKISGFSSGEFQHPALLAMLNDGVNQGWGMHRSHDTKQRPDQN